MGVAKRLQQSSPQFRVVKQQDREADEPQAQRDGAEVPILIRKLIQQCSGGPSHAEHHHHGDSRVQTPAEIGISGAEGRGSRSQLPGALESGGVHGTLPGDL